MRHRRVVSFALFDHGFSILKNPLFSGTGAQPVTSGRSVSPPALAHPGDGDSGGDERHRMDLAAWEHWLDSHSSHARSGGSVRLLINGEKFFPCSKTGWRSDRNNDIQSASLTGRRRREVAALLKQRSTTLPCAGCSTTPARAPPQRASRHAPGGGLRAAGSISRYLDPFALQVRRSSTRS